MASFDTLRALRQRRRRLVSGLGLVAATTLTALAPAAAGVSPPDPGNSAGATPPTSQDMPTTPAGSAAAPSAAREGTTPAEALRTFLYRQRPSGRAELTRLRAVPGGGPTTHIAVNDRGQVTGPYIPDGAVQKPDGTYDTMRGFVQDRRGNALTFAVPDALITLPEGIDDQGQIAGAYVDADAVLLPDGQAPPGSVHGFFRDRRGRITTFDAPFWRLHAVADVNNRGQMVGYYDEVDFTGGGAFLRERDGTFTTINFPGALYTQAHGINDRGQIVGAYLQPGAAPNPDGTLPRNTVHGFVWQDGRFTTFDVPGSVFTQAFGINNRGQISGGYRDAAGRQHGFLRDGRRYRTLDSPGGGGNIAWGINDQGEVVLPDPRLAGLLPVAP